MTNADINDKFGSDVWEKIKGEKITFSEGARALSGDGFSGTEYTADPVDSGAEISVKSVLKDGGKHPRFKIEIRVPAEGGISHKVVVTGKFARKAFAYCSKPSKVAKVVDGATIDAVDEALNF